MRSKLLVIGTVALSAVFACCEAPGEAVFKKNCVMCHGADGAGKTKMGVKLGAANLSSNDIQALSDEAMSQTIRNGKNKMPPFGNSLSAEEISQVVQYVRTLRK